MSYFDDERKECRMEYAQAYILPQRYGNLYSANEGFWKGTIFKDLYRPYKCKK